MTPPVIHDGFGPVAQCHPEKSTASAALLQADDYEQLGRVLRGTGGRREKNHIKIKKFIPFFAV